MASKKVLVHLDLQRQQLLNAALENRSTAPSTPTAGQIYWNTTDNTAYVYKGNGWLDLGQIYTHPVFSGATVPSTPTTGANIISSITLNNGHVTGVSTRSLTAADINASQVGHKHVYTDVIDVLPNTILGNNGASNLPAKALSVQNVLTMLDITLGLGVRDGFTQTITNSAKAGNSIVLPAATITLAGLLTASDKVKLDGIAAGANAYTHPNVPVYTNPFNNLVESPSKKILSQLVMDNAGHVTKVMSRDLTNEDIKDLVITDATVDSSDSLTWDINTIKAKINSVITGGQLGALVYIGGYNPVTNVPNIKSTTPQVLQGYVYVISNAGNFLGAPVESGDMLIAKSNDPQSDASKWQIVNKNIPEILDAAVGVKGIIAIASPTDITQKSTTTAVTPAQLSSAILEVSGGVRGYKVIIGDGVSTIFDITHNLGTLDILCQCRSSSDKSEVWVDWKPLTTITMRVSVNIPPVEGGYEVLITKI